MVYESLLAFAVTFFAALAFFAATGGVSAPGGRHLFQAYLFLVLGSYFVFCWRRSGSTLAMQTWNLRVVRRDGAPLGAGRAWLRYALAWPSVMLFGVGILWALIDRDRQFLHDRLAGTKIVTGARSVRPTGGIPAP